MRLSKFIKTRRKELGLTQDGLAYKLRFCSNQYVSNVERGMSAFTKKKLKILAKVLKAKESDLRSMWVYDYLRTIKHKTNDQMND